MFQNCQPYLLGLLLMTLISCEFDSANITTVEPNTNLEIATSEAVPDVVRPILLVDPIGEAGVVTTAEITLSGHIILTDSSITVFTSTLNNSAANDVLPSLAQDNHFSFLVSDLQEGTNTVTLNVADSLNATTSLDISITYSKPIETTEPEDSSGDDDTETEITPEPEVDLMSLVLDILNTTQSRYADFANLLEIFQDNEAALTSIFDFLSTWDGSDAALQEWWNEWANAGTIKIAQFDAVDTTQAQENTWQLDDVRISLNDISHITQVLFPQLADELNDVTNSDDFVVLQNHKEVLWCDFEWSVKITSITSTLNLSTDGITNIEFLDNNQVSISLDLANATMDSNIKLIANPPKACVFNDSSRTGDVSGKKLTGTLVLQLDYDSDSKTLLVSDIVSSSLKVGSVTASMDEADSFWQGVTEWIFKRLHGCNFCSDSDAEKALFQYVFDIDDDDPYKTMFNAALQTDDHIQNMLLAEFNKIFTTALQFDGNISTAESQPSFNYETAMTNFTTDADRDQLLTEWSLAVAASEPRDSCARLFKIPDPATTRSNMARIGDIGVQLTYDQIATMLQGIARTGAFCFNQDITIDSLTLAQLDLRPYGTIEIADSNNQNSHLDVTYPFEINVNWGNADNSNTQNLVLNAFTGSSVNNKIYGSVVLSVHLATDCEAGLTLSVDQIELVSLDGTLKINTYTFDLDIIRGELTEWLNNISLTSLQNIPLTSQLVDLEGLENISVEMEKTFIATDTDLNLGLTLVENSSCQ